MKKATILAAIVISAAGLWGQDIGFGIGAGRGGGAGAFAENFQQVVTMAAPGGPRGAVQQLIQGTLARGEGISRQTVTGRPVSGTDEQKSTQTLSDGTVITNSSTDRFYRDSEGRTRTEDDADGRVVIFDPVAHMEVILMTETKTARRMAVSPNAGKAEMAVSFNGATKSITTTYSSTTGATTATTTIAGGYESRLNWLDVPGADHGPAENAKKEDLGVESLNGILAAHTRSTLTIPQGQIGNDRDIHVVNERWYSDDLQMLVKTVNSDPRFGENTYQFTNISRDEPDPSLFQIPSDYTVIEMGGARVNK
jgi:hypothetical protein